MTQQREKWLKGLTIAILLIGIVVRIVVYFQNRNLFIDEANVARNIYERGFKELPVPLSYEQYAPPLFLWMVKVCALLFGYGEKALRLFPLISGIGALFLFVAILRRIASYRSLWYPLFLLATGYIFIRYSSELKQYMSDVFVVLALVWLTLRTDIQQTRSVKFALIWLLAGSVAIWLCMPSVFVLTGIGAYYCCICIQQKRYAGLLPLAIVGLLWVAQFAFYYIVILKPQADSAYLQNFHEPYFLYLKPIGKGQWMHNWYVCKELLEETGGYPPGNWIFNLLLLAIGSLLLFRKNTATALLLILPLAEVIAAAALHKYSLIPRVAMFMMPLMLLLIGYGLEKLLAIHFVPLQLGIIIIAILSVRNFNMIRMVYKPYNAEDITREFAFLKQQNITGSELYVHTGARPAYIYYTQIHPDKAKWAQLDNAHLLWWDQSYEALAQHITGRAAFIYTSISPDDLNNCKAAVSKYMMEGPHIEDAGTWCFVYIYTK